MILVKILNIPIHPFTTKSIHLLKNITITMNNSGYWLGIERQCWVHVMSHRSNGIHFYHRSYMDVISKLPDIYDLNCFYDRPNISQTYVSAAKLVLFLRYNLFGPNRSVQSIEKKKIWDSILTACSQYCTVEIMQINAFIHNTVLNE